jgi:hypothetical protein
MARFTRGLVVTLGVVLLGFFITIVPQKTALGQNGNTQPVFVTNKTVPTTVTNTPLPVSGNLAATVSGSVAVSNFPATQNVNVTNAALPVTGTVTANINGTPTVNANISNSSLSALITNPTTNPVLNRNIDRPENQPFNVPLCTVGAGGVSLQPQQCFFGGETSPQLLTVPTTTGNGLTVQRLVIEYVDGACNAAASSVTAVTLSAAAGGNLGGFGPPTFTNQFNHFFPLTALPGGAVTWGQAVRFYAEPGSQVVFFISATLAPGAGCTMNITGYLTTQ